MNLKAVVKASYEAGSSQWPCVSSFFSRYSVGVILYFSLELKVMSLTVTMKIKGSDLAFVGYDGKWRLEKGDFKIKCGNLWADIHCAETKLWETANK